MRTPYLRRQQKRRTKRIPRMQERRVLSGEAISRSKKKREEWKVKGWKALLRIRMRMDWREKETLRSFTVQLMFSE